MKLDILFHYNVDENTGEITFIGKEEITVRVLIFGGENTLIEGDTALQGDDKEYNKSGNRKTHKGIGVYQKRNKLENVGLYHFGEALVVIEQGFILEQFHEFVYSGA